MREMILRVAEMVYIDKYFILYSFNVLLSTFYTSLHFSNTFEIFHFLDFTRNAHDKITDTKDQLFLLFRKEACKVFEMKR